MRSLTSCLLLAASLAFAQPPARPGQQPQTSAAPIPDASHLEGTVFSMAGEPVRQATIRLDPVFRALGFPAGGFTATTDAQGKFVMDNIAPGRYTMTASRQGFIPQKYGAKTSTAPGTTLNLETQQKLIGLEIRLIPQGIIRGRITDQDGDPIRQARVAALKLTFDRTGPHLSETLGTQTDDKGEFTIQNVPPGRYSVVSEPSPDLFTAIPGYVMTYYPNSIDPSAATLVEVAAGSNVQGIDIRLRREQVYSFKAKVVDSTTSALVPDAFFDWTVKGARNGPSDRRIFRTRDDGSLTIKGMLPGTYLIEMLQGGTVNGGSVGVLGQTGRMELNVTDHNIDDVVFSLTPGARLWGTSQMEDKAQSLGTYLKAGALPNVTAVPVDGSITVPNRMNGDGTFMLEKVAAGAYYLDVAALPNTVYLKSARIAGRDVTHTAMDLVGGQNTVDLVLSSKPADVSGSVRNSAGDMLGGVSVSLWTRMPDAGLVGQGARSTVTDQAGNFKFNSLPPGGYYLVAWEEVDPGLAQYYTYLARFNSRAVKVDVGEGAHETVDPKLISIADSATELTRMNVTWPPMFSSRGTPPPLQTANAQHPIVGRVLDSKGEAVRKAVVRIDGVSTFAGQTVAFTDSDGKFSFEEAPLTSFELSAAKDGYLLQRLGAQQPGSTASVAPAAKLRVKKGEQLKNLEFKLTPQGVISGRVISQAGEPVSGVQVVTYVYEFQGTRRQPTGQLGAATGPDGSYRIAGLSPGRYYLRANTQGVLAGLLNPGTTAGAAPREANVSTFFPGVTDLSQAKALDVEPGAEIKGVDIQMVNTRVFAVRGKGVTPDGGPVVDQIFTLRPKDRTNLGLSGGTATPDRAGVFEFRSIAPGTYMVLAGLTRVGNSYASPTLFAAQEITVTDANVDGVTLALTAGVPITGSVSVENSNLKPRPTIVLSEMPDSSTGFQTTSLFKDDGTFEMRTTLPGRYQLRALNAPAGIYLKSAMFGSQDVIHRPLELGVGAGQLNLVFSTRVAQLNGTAKDVDGKPVGNAMVSLWPRTPEIGVQGGSARFTSTSPAGLFEFADVSPGDYFLTAWENVDLSLLRSPEFPDLFQAAAAKITVGEDARWTGDVPVIMRKQVDEAIAKLK